MSCIETKGRYHLVLKDKNGNVKSDLSFTNMITDKGLEDWFNTGIPTSVYIQIADNHVIPIRDVTTLGDNSIIGELTPVVTKLTEENGSYTYNHQFIQSFKANKKLSANRIGCLNGANKNLFSIANLIDDTGHPYTLDVETGDTVDVLYEFLFRVNKGYDQYDLSNGLTENHLNGNNTVQYTLSVPSNPVPNANLKGLLEPKLVDIVASQNNILTGVAPQSTKHTLTYTDEGLEIKVIASLDASYEINQLKQIKDMMLTTPLFNVRLNYNPSINRHTTPMTAELEANIVIMR